MRWYCSCTAKALELLFRATLRPIADARNVRRDAEAPSGGTARKPDSRVNNDGWGEHCVDMMESVWYTAGTCLPTWASNMGNPGPMPTQHTLPVRLCSLLGGLQGEVRWSSRAIWGRPGTQSQSSRCGAPRHISPEHSRPRRHCRPETSKSSASATQSGEARTRTSHEHLISFELLAHVVA